MPVNLFNRTDGRKIDGGLMLAQSSEACMASINNVSTQLGDMLSKGVALLFSIVLGVVCAECHTKHQQHQLTIIHTAGGALNRDE